MNADQAKAVAEVIGQNLQGEWMHTYKAINALPEAKKDYKPETNARTAWDLAHHIAICDVGFLHAVAANSFSAFPAKWLMAMKLTRFGNTSRRMMCHRPISSAKAAWKRPR